MAQNLRAARCLLLSFSVSLSLGLSPDALCAPLPPPSPSEEEELVPRFFNLFAAAGYGSDPSERAAWAVRLQRLTQLGVKEVTDELEELAGKIKDFLEILGSRDRIMAINGDFALISKTFGQATAQM